VTERERDCVVTTLGAIAGAVVSYLLFTERGNAVRRQIAPAFEDLERELSHLRGTVVRSAGIASESWRLLNDAMGSASSPRRSMADPHQNIPY
jgi:hypothetical protein